MATWSPICGGKVTGESGGRHQAARRVVPGLRRRRERRGRPEAPGRLPRRLRRRDDGLQPGRRHGRHGLHREQQGAVHALGADQHAPAAWPRRKRASSASSTPARPASTTPTSRRSDDVVPLKEEDAYPAMPEDGYGWEKLFSERMCRHFREDFGLDTRVARFHNVYGPHGTWDGGREKAPAAICRKVIDAKSRPASTRSRSGATASRPAASCTSTTASRASTASCTATSRSRSTSARASWSTINGLVDIVEDIAGVKLKRKYNLDAPKGVNGRNSDNTLIKNFSAGSRASACATAWKRPTTGFCRSIATGSSSPKRRADRLLQTARRVDRLATRLRAATTAAERVFPHPAIRYE